MASDFIPNSFQTPNAYIDRFMYLLTSEEWKVLSYAVRRIFGFQKRSDRISLSQFMDGTSSTTTDVQLDHGTGLSKPTVQKALAQLTHFGLMIKLAANDEKKNEGDLYALQLDSDQVDVAGLEDRANHAAHRDRKRSESGRAAAAEKRRRSMPLTDGTEVVNAIDQGWSTPLTGSDGVEVVNATDQGWSTPLTGGGQRDRPGMVNRVDTQNTEEIQRENQEENQRATDAAAPPAPTPPKMASQPSKKSRTPAKRAGPLVEHPAVAVYRDLMHRTPNDVQRQLIADTVGNNGHLESWKTVLTDWKAHAWNSGNVPGQLDAFQKLISGQRDPTPAPQHPTPIVNPAREALKKILEEQASGNQN